MIDLESMPLGRPTVLEIPAMTPLASNARRNSPPRTTRRVPAQCTASRHEFFIGTSDGELEGFCRRYGLTGADVGCVVAVVGVVPVVGVVSAGCVAAMTAAT